MSELHKKLIDELLSGKVSLSPREQAAVNEIEALREQLAPKAEKKPVKKDD